MVVMENTKQNTVVRPKFDPNKIDRNHKAFKTLVDQYQRWSQSGDIDESRETYENDIIGCLGHYNLDGYQLAKRLESTVYLEADSELVGILDDLFFVKDSLVRSMLKTWVDENSLTIDPSVVGKKVNAKQGFHKYENHYITGIRSETYEVTISTETGKNGGFVIDYENIQFVD